MSSSMVDGRRRVTLATGRADAGSINAALAAPAPLLDAAAPPGAKDRNAFPIDPNRDVDALGMNAGLSDAA